MSFINELLSLSNTAINFNQYIINKDLSIYQDGVITLEHFTDIMKKNIDYFTWYNDIKKNNNSNKKIIPESKYLFNDNVNSKSVLKLDLLQLPLLVDSYNQGEAHQQAPNTDVPPAPPAPVQNTDIPQAQNTDIQLAPILINKIQQGRDKLKKQQPQQKIQQAPKNEPPTLIEQIKQGYKLKPTNQKQRPQVSNDDPYFQALEKMKKKIQQINTEKNDENDEWNDEDDEWNDEDDKVDKELYKQQLNALKNQYSKLKLNVMLKKYEKEIISNINEYLNINDYKYILNDIKKYESYDSPHINIDIDIKKRYEDIITYINNLYTKKENDISYIKFIKDMIFIIVSILLGFKYKIQDINKDLTDQQQKTINEKFCQLIDDISKSYIKYIYKLITKEYFKDIIYYDQIQDVFNNLYKYINDMNFKLKILNENDINNYEKFNNDLLRYYKRLSVRYGGNNNLNKYINNIITLLNNDGDVDLTIFNLYNMLQINYLLALHLIEKTINCDIIKNNILYQKITEEEINNYIKNNYICFNFNNTVNIQQNMLFKDINCKHCIDIDNIVNNIIYGKYFIKKIKDDDFTYDNFINLISNYSNYKHILLILNESSLKSLFNLIKKFVKYITDNKINYVNSSLINFSYFVKNIIDKFINSDINSNDDINTDIEDIKRLYYNNFIFENNYVICFIIWNKLKNIYKPHTKITSYEPKYIKHDISNMIKKQSNTIKYNNDNKINNFFINNKLQNNKLDVLFEINKMATMNGGNLNKDMYTTIYEQIFDNIQNKLKSHKIKINQNDIIKITNKINDIKQYEKELIKIFKIMAKYTSQPNLTKLKHTEINYDMIKNFDDKYNKLCNNRIVDKYNKLCNNHNIAIIDIINTFNKINHRISNIIN